MLRRAKNQTALILDFRAKVRRIPSASRVALGLALLIAGFQFAPFFPHLIASMLVATRAPLPTDFPTFYYAAVAYRMGGNPYDLSAFAAGVQTAGAQLYPFLYPPTSLPAFFPLAFGTIEASLLVFQLISFCCVIYIAFTAIRIADDEQWPMLWRMVGLIALTGFNAIGLTFMFGQVNLMATAAILFAWKKARRSGGGSEAAIAVAMLIATMLKTYPALLVIPFMLRRDFKVVAWFIILAAADLLLVAMTTRHGVWHFWIFQVLPTSRFGLTPMGLFPPSHPANQSLNGALSRVLGEGRAAEFGTTVQLAMLGTATLVCWLMREKDRREFYDFGFGLIIVATFLIAPLSWFHHLVFLIPALLACASIVNRDELRDSIGWRFALLLATVMIALPWPELDPEHHMAAFINTLPIAGPLVLFAMLAALPLVLSWRAARLELNSIEGLQSLR